MANRWKREDSLSFWRGRDSNSILAYNVTLRRERELQRRKESRRNQIQSRRDAFFDEFDLEDGDDSSILKTPEAEDLKFWCSEQSWSYCDKCHKLARRKLLPNFRNRNPTATENSCKCGNGVYSVPTVDDVPLLLRNLTEDDVRVLRPFTIHSGEYQRHMYGYRQRTGAFRVSWCELLVEDKIQRLEDDDRRRRLGRVYSILMARRESSYRKFVEMQKTNPKKPFLYEIFSSPEFEGIECALWPSLYHSSSMCESKIKGQTNRASGKVSFMHKVLSSVQDFSLNFDLLQYQYDRWLFKTITGAINSSKFSGCSPNTALQDKCFSATFWKWQHLYLVDAVRQYGFPSFFLTISPYEWTFPWPPFLKKLREQYGKEPTDVPVLETLHVGHVLEQVARGYLAGANSNRWRNHVFGNMERPTENNVQTYFYRFEFQERGTLHLHMLVWVKDIASIRANLLKASIPWQNPEDAFVVADTQKSDRSCLPLNPQPDSFVEDQNGVPHLQFQYGEEEAQRNIRAYVTTILGALKCRTDVQLADGKGMLLKYVSSYVTKMHEAATSEGLYCTDLTGFQAAHSFLRTVRPLEPEMVFQLSNIHVCWTDKLTKQFKPPFPDQTDGNTVYQLYLRRPPTEEDLPLLQWLRNHSISNNKSKPLDKDKYLVGLKYVSVFNPVYFFQHLLVHWPHRNAAELRHSEESTMPQIVKFFSRALALQPGNWTTAEQIRSQFQYEGHREHFVTTVVAYVMALHDALHLWRIRVVDSTVSILNAVSIERVYPLSPLQMAIFQDIKDCLAKRKERQHNSGRPSEEADWAKYRIIMGKPGTGKSQVVIRAIHDAVQMEHPVLVCAPVALLAQGYRAIFSSEVETDTIHAAFNIPIEEGVAHDTNFRLNSYDLVVVDEASMVSKKTFSIMASTFNRLNLRPVVVVAGDKCQQQPLQNVGGKVSSTTSILNDDTFSSANSERHTLFQQFRIIDPEYARFLDMIRHIQPTQQQVDDLQKGRVLCPTGELSDDQLWDAFASHTDASIMTVSRRAAQRLNSLVVKRLFPNNPPLTNIACASVSELEDIFPHRGMRIVITENRDKTSKIVNGHDATVVSNQGNTILVRFPDGGMAFVYPVTHPGEDGNVTRYPFTPAYARTICKSQGQNLKHLIVWLDCERVPKGMAYVALSRVRKKANISFMQPLRHSQMLPVDD